MGRNDGRLAWQDKYPLFPKSWVAAIAIIVYSFVGWIIWVAVHHG